MGIYWIRKPVLLGLGLSATLAVAVAGCGGEGGNKDNGVLVSAPDASVNSKRRLMPPRLRELPPAEPARRVRAQYGTDPVRGPSRLKGGGRSRGRSSSAALHRNPRSWSRWVRPQKDPEVCAKAAPIMSEQLVVDPSTKGVKNAFVYLLKPSAVNPEAKKAAESAKPEFDQKGCVYYPHALAVMVGETVKVKTSDPVSHNVNFQLRALQENKVLAPGNSMDVTPSSPERNPGPVSCSIHPWMQAYWLVLDHPYFAITDEKGNFEIKNVPAGTQKVVVWQEAVSHVTPSSGEDVNIEAMARPRKTYTIDPTKVRAEWRRIRQIGTAPAV